MEAQFIQGWFFFVIIKTCLQTLPSTTTEFCCTKDHWAKNRHRQQDLP